MPANDTQLACRILSRSVVTAPVFVAVAYARGIEGRMLPCPEMAGSDEAVALLRLAAEVGE